jgi:DNA-binding transcriptional LysR family regulator
MLSLHQLRCFTAAYEHRSFTAAATELGYAQPSLSEQIRLLERAVGAPLFTRAGRGVIPTEAGEALLPHAQRTLAAAAQAREAVASVATLETGTLRFGIFGTARLYMGAALIGDVLERHPGLRVELIGQNSTEVLEELRRGRLEAAMISLPVADDSMAVRPVAREELVYVSADPERLRSPITAKALAAAELVLPEATWRTQDASRVLLNRFAQEAGQSLQTRVECEDVETALELVQRGLADSVVQRGVLDELGPRLAPDVGAVSLRPRLYDTIAVVHRKDAVLSPGARLAIELAVARIQAVTEPVRSPSTG